MDDLTVHPDPRRWYALALVCSAMFMVILDASIVVVAAPSISESLAFSAGHLQWVVSAYAVSFGGLLLLGGRSSDLLGRRRMFMLGTTLFAAASLICGLARSSEVLIGARVLQGMSAAIMAPTALSILMTLFAEGRERNRALGVWSGVGAVGGIAGWLIGGPLTSSLGWQWIFFINVPVGLIMLSAARVLLSESRVPVMGDGAFDLAGAVTITGALLLLVDAVVEAPASGWGSPRTLGLFALSVALTALFGVIEARSSAPLLPVRLLTSRSLIGGNFVVFTLGLLAWGVTFTLSQYAQEVLGYSALRFGVSSALMPAMAVVGSLVGQAIITRGGFRWVAVGGMVLCGVACVLLTHISVQGSYMGDIFWCLVIFGSGFGLSFVAGSVATLEGIDESEAGLASGLNNASFQIGGAVGVAIVSSVAVSHVTGPEHLVALTEGYRAAFGVSLVFALAGLLAGVLLLGPSRRVRSGLDTSAAGVAQ